MHPLTFFTTQDERKQIVRALRAWHPQRVVALMLALGLIDEADGQGDDA